MMQVDMWLWTGIKTNEEVPESPAELTTYNNHKKMSSKIMLHVMKTYRSENQTVTSTYHEYTEGTEPDSHWYI